MSHTRVVTDSAADLSAELVEELRIVVVPMRLRLGTETVSDGPELRTPDFYRRIIKQKIAPQVLAPDARQFAEVYGQLARETSDIVSLHLSARFNNTVAAALEGRVAYMGRNHIAVIDSQFISRAQGILVIEAARAALAGASAAEIERLIRGMLAHTYLVFHVEMVEYLRRAGLMRPAREGIAGVPTVKPLLLLEGGEITPLQRLRNRGKPIERLFEFVAEFSTLKELAILHTGSVPDLEEFKAQLVELFPREIIREHIYGPTFGAYVGPAALGVVAFEGAGTL